LSSVLVPPRYTCKGCWGAYIAPGKHASVLPTCLTCPTRPTCPTPTCPSVALRGRRADFTADGIHFLQQPENVLAQNVLHILLAVSLCEERRRDLRQLRRVLHPVGHRRPVEIGSESDVRGPDQLHGAVAVFDDL